MLVNEVVQVNLAEKGQANIVSNESDFELEERKVAPEGEMKSASSVMN